MGCAASAGVVNGPRRASATTRRDSRPLTVLALDAAAHNNTRPTQQQPATGAIDDDNTFQDAWSPEFRPSSVTMEPGDDDAAAGGGPGDVEDVDALLEGDCELANPLVIQPTTAPLRPASDNGDSTGQQRSYGRGQFARSLCSLSGSACPAPVSPHTLLAQSADTHDVSATNVVLFDLHGAGTDENSQRRSAFGRSDRILRRSVSPSAAAGSRSPSLGPQLLSIAAMAELDDNASQQQQQRRSTHGSSRGSRSSSRAQSRPQSRRGSAKRRSYAPAMNASVDDDDVRRQSAMSLDEMLGNVGILAAPVHS